MPRARIRVEELLKWQARLPTPTFWNAKGLKWQACLPTPTFWNAKSGEGFLGGGPGAYLVAKPFKLKAIL